MLIRMRTNLGGPEYNIPAGKIGNVDTAFAKDLIAKGYAEAVDSSRAETETAEAPPVSEKAVKPQPMKKGKA